MVFNHFIMIFDQLFTNDSKLNIYIKKKILMTQNHQIIFKINITHRKTIQNHQIMLNINRIHRKTYKI